MKFETLRYNIGSVIWDILSVRKTIERLFPIIIKKLGISALKILILILKLTINIFPIQKKILENSSSKLNPNNSMFPICNIANNPNVLIILTINITILITKKVPM